MNSINLVIKLGVLTCCGCGGVGEGEGEEAVEDVAEAAGLEEDCECEADTVTGESRRFLSLGISEIRLFREALRFLFTVCLNLIIPIRAMF